MMTNIDFLKAVLNKQFELVGCNKTTEEVINMDAEQQLEFWNSYKITQEQHNEWRKYFMELAPENEEFKSVENEEIFQDVLDAVFETISEEWEFEFSDEDNLSEDNSFEDETDNNDDLENE